MNVQTSEGNEWNYKLIYDTFIEERIVYKCISVYMLASHWSSFAKNKFHRAHCAFSIQFDNQN